MPRAALRASPQHHRLDGLDDDVEVERDRQVLDVEELVLEFLESIFAACAVRVFHLRPTREPRPHGVPLAVKRNLLSELLDELRALGPRSNETHVAYEHIP